MLGLRYIKESDRSSSFGVLIIILNNVSSVFDTNFGLLHRIQQYWIHVSLELWCFVGTSVCTLGSIRYLLVLRHHIGRYVRIECSLVSVLVSDVSISNVGVMKPQSLH